MTRLGTRSALISDWIIDTIFLSERVELKGAKIIECEEAFFISAF
jgi:hypothetical protein